MRRFYMLLILVIFSTAQDVLAQSAQFSRLTGPPGANARSLTNDRNGNILLLTDSYDLYRSTNLGISWTALRMSGKDQVYTLAVDSSNAIVLVINPGKFLRSTDTGTTWSEAMTGLTARFVLKLLFHPSGSLIAGSSSGVYVWTDTSGVWTRRDSSITSVFSLLLLSNGSVLAGGSGGKVMRSDDGGWNWTPRTAAPGGVSIQKMAVGSDGTLVAATYTSLVHSPDTGSTWAAGPTVPGIGLSMFSGDAGAVYATSSQGIWKILSNGSAIGSISGTGLRVPWLDCGVEVQGSIIVGGGGDVYRSTNNGSSWQIASTGLMSADIRDLIIDHENNLFTAAWGGYFRSTDQGDTWTELVPSPTSFYGSAIFRSRLGYMLIGTSNGIFRSEGPGSPWVLSNTGMTATPAQHFRENNIGWVFGGAQGQGVVRSTDQGQSWTGVNQGIVGLAIQGLVIDNNDNLYARYPAGVVYTSTNSGSTWTLFSPGGSSSSGPLFSGLYVSDDGTILRSNEDGGIGRSTDGGLTFTEVAPMTLTGGDIRSIASRGDGVVYAASVTGLFVSADSGITWSVADTSDALTPWHVLKIDSTGNVFLATLGKGVYRYRALPTGMVVDEPIPSRFTLEQNYPNPFNPTTMLTFEIDRDGPVELTVYDVLGRKVATLVNGDMVQGKHSVVWNAGGSASGVYFCRLVSGSGVRVKGMLLQK